MSQLLSPYQIVHSLNQSNSNFYPFNTMNLSSSNENIDIKTESKNNIITIFND